MKWNKYKLKTTTQAEDFVSGVLMELGISGIQVEDNVQISQEDKEKQFIDYLADLPEDDGTAYISFYTEEDNDDEALLHKVREKLKDIQDNLSEENLDLNNNINECIKDDEQSLALDTDKLEKKIDKPVTTGKSISIDQNKTVDLNLQTAKKMVAFAEQKAKEINVPVVISVVDSGGHIILMERMEDSLLASIDISLNKAYTALSLKMATEDVQNLCKPGDPLYGIQESNNNRIITFGGGIPFTYKGKVVGALGVSGGTVEEDTYVAKYAIESVVNLN